MLQEKRKGAQQRKRTKGQIDNARQSAKFIELAKAVVGDDGQETFRQALRKVATAKPKPAG
jgi:hypothetical protein